MKYRKKPVVIEAEVFDPVHADLPFSRRGDPCCLDPEKGQWFITTLEGKLWCTPGDYIIRGVNGEFYPCKPDIFAKTYEVASTDLAPDPVKEALATALQALGSMPGGYCFCYGGKRDPLKLSHYGECREARDALARYEAEGRTT